MRLYVLGGTRMPDAFLRRSQVPECGRKVPMMFVMWLEPRGGLPTTGGSQKARSPALPSISAVVQSAMSACPASAVAMTVHGCPTGSLNRIVEAGLRAAPQQQLHRGRSMKVACTDW